LIAGSESTSRSVVRNWAEMVKFSHSVFAFPFALMATFLAGRELDGGRPRWLHLLLIVVCMVAARSVAMTFNRLIDAAIDHAIDHIADIISGNLQSAMNALHSRA